MWLKYSVWKKTSKPRLELLWTQQLSNSAKAMVETLVIRCACSPWLDHKSKLVKEHQSSAVNFNQLYMKCEMLIAESHVSQKQNELQTWVAIYIYNFLRDSHLLLYRIYFVAYHLFHTESDSLLCFFVPETEVKEKGLDLEESMAAKWMYLGERKCLEKNIKKLRPGGFGLISCCFFYKLKGGWGFLLKLKS